MEAAQDASVADRPLRIFRLRPDALDRADEAASLGTRRTGSKLFLIAAALAFVGFAAFSIDCVLAQWFVHGHEPKYLHRLATMSEVFGRGEFVLLVVLFMWQLDRARRWAVPSVAAIALCSGLTADILKLLIVRARPYSFDFIGSVWSTFGQWFPLASAGSAGQSFPSAHTATAVGLVVALMWLYPAARSIFCLLPMLVAYQRIESGAHFLSDVLCGAAVGCFMAAICLKANWLEQRSAENFYARLRLLIPGRRTA